MKKWFARVATVLALAGALVGVGATAAQAAWRLAGTYGWPDQCLGVGYYGVQQGQWAQYYCETVVPANPASGPGLYKLWVQ